MVDRIDPRERIFDQEEATRMANEGQMVQVWTALPVIIKKHDREKNTAHAQSSIKSAHQKPDGSIEWREHPVMEDLPVLYPGGGNTSITMPLKEGDEALAIFASRSVDKWWHEGGVQEQTDSRMHSLSDGFIVPGFRSQPRKLKNISEKTWQLRTDEENPDQIIDFDPENKKITITSPNPVTIKADLHVTGEIIAKHGDTNIHLSTHKHDGVQSGGDDTTKPLPNT